MKVPFVDCKGQRAIKGAYKLDKFCEQCGTKLQNNKAKLTKHCNKFHKAIQCGFLKSNQLPKDSLYLNSNNFMKLFANLSVNFNVFWSHFQAFSKITWSRFCPTTCQSCFNNFSKTFQHLVKSVMSTFQGFYEYLLAPS